MHFSTMAAAVVPRGRLGATHPAPRHTRQPTKTIRWSLFRQGQGRRVCWI